MLAIVSHGLKVYSGDFPKAGSVEMARQPRMHYKPWTSADVKELRRLAKQKLHVSAIAKKLNRTAFAVRNRASSEGISLQSSR